MTHFQEVFIKNLRFFRKKRGLSQLAFSEMLNISPNYLNAVENGRNFPSPEVIQGMLDNLDLLPYQLFLEEPFESMLKKEEEKGFLVQELTNVKRYFNNEIDKIIKNAGNDNTEIALYPRKHHPQKQQSSSD